MTISRNIIVVAFAVAACSGLSQLNAAQPRCSDRKTVFFGASRDDVRNGLFIACMQGDLAYIKSTLAEFNNPYAIISERDEYAETLLYDAAAAGRVSIVRYFLEIAHKAGKLRDFVNMTNKDGKNASQYARDVNTQQFQTAAVVDLLERVEAQVDKDYQSQED